VRLKELIQQGLIGQLQKIVVTMGSGHYGPGGGKRGHQRPHLLGILEAISGGHN